MASRIITLFFVGFGCSVVIRFLLLLDVNKRVYNHAPSTCRLVRAPANGSAGMVLIPELGVALITTGYAKRRGITGIAGGVLLYDLKDNRNYEAKQLKIKGFNPQNFIPYGISTYVSRGRVTVYITNSNPDNDTVEVFQLDRDHLILTHRKTITDNTFRNLADIAVVGADRFFATNHVYGRKRWMQLMEFALQSSFGSVIYYDGRGGNYVEKYFPTPNGIEVNKEQNRLYVASTINEFIRIYQLRRDMSVVHETEISLFSSPNKLFIEDATGDIWTALHPVLYKAHKHIQDPLDMDQRSPSQVLRIRVQKDGRSWVVTEPYANDGATIWGSSAVIFHKDALLIGSLFGRTLHCDIDNPQIV